MTTYLNFVHNLHNLAMVKFGKIETSMWKIKDYSIKFFVLETLVLSHVVNIHFVQDGTAKTLKFNQVARSILPH